MDANKVYPRGDSSAWKGDEGLAYLCGLLAGSLLHDAGRCLWEVSSPNGYAPVLELFHFGRRFRLTVEAIDPPTE